MITQELLAVIKKQFRINWHGKHGIYHWARVYEIGIRLAEKTGANRNVVELFSVFHDSRRYNEHTDPEHGPRGAELAGQLWKIHFPSLIDEEFNLLNLACCLHTSASTHQNVVIQTCFDADRLDLGRVDKVPNPKLLCTDAAKSEKMIAWAYERSVRGDIPDNVLGRDICRLCPVL